MKYKISAPFYVPTSKKKNFRLNLNNYRNAHFQVLNLAKKNFEIIIYPDVFNLPCMQQIELTYTLYPANKRLFDISNICSIVDKFFCDSLVRQNKLPDDNYNHIKKVVYQFGNIDKTDPRIEVEITII